MLRTVKRVFSGGAQGETERESVPKSVTLNQLITCTQANLNNMIYEFNSFPSELLTQEIEDLKLRINNLHIELLEEEDFSSGKLSPDGKILHRYTNYFFLDPAQCDFCQELIHSGLICCECGFQVHNDCKEKVSNQCNVCEHLDDQTNIYSIKEEEEHIPGFKMLCPENEKTKRNNSVNHALSYSEFDDIILSMNNDDEKRRKSVHNLAPSIFNATSHVYSTTSQQQKQYQAFGHLRELSSQSDDSVFSKHVKTQNNLKSSSKLGKCNSTNSDIYNIKSDYSDKNNNSNSDNNNNKNNVKSEDNFPVKKRRRKLSGSSSGMACLLKSFSSFLGTSNSSQNLYNSSKKIKSASRFVGENSYMQSGSAPELFFNNKSNYNPYEKEKQFSENLSCFENHGLPRPSISTSSSQNRKVYKNPERQRRQRQRREQKRKSLNASPPASPRPEVPVRKVYSTTPPVVEDCVYGNEADRSRSLSLDTKAIFNYENTREFLYGLYEMNYCNTELDDSYDKESIADWEIDEGELEILECAGSGSFGTVYKGNWHGEVAIKKLHCTEPSQGQMEAFRNEVKTLMRCRHQNIILFMGACCYPTPTIITEWCSGSTLYHLIHVSDYEFEVMNVLKIIHQVALGIGYLHDKEILHRDLKSPNIFLDSNNHVRVGDFGLAAVKTLYSEEKGKNSTNPLPGSVLWMAPEVMKSKPGKIHYENGSDIYSFGVVFYEMLTGKLPHRNLHPAQIVFQIAMGILKIDVEKEAFVEVPENLKEMVDRCVQSDITKRPSAKDIATQLKQEVKLISRSRKRSLSESNLVNFEKGRAEFLGSWDYKL